MTDARQDGAPKPDDVDAIKAEIDATREQLARTVDELSARLDVPARAKERAYRARDTAVETYRESPPLTIAAALALAGVLVGLVILRRKRAARRRSEW
jgi:ElaB/YqjD/DUF883 family membrane-anchored ribosome-binding protein